MLKPLYLIILGYKFKLLNQIKCLMKLYIKNQ